MKAKMFLALCAIALSTFSVQAQDEDARRKAQQAVNESMLKAQAEKAKQDEIVRKQREQENARKRDEALDKLNNEVNKGTATPE